MEQELQLQQDDEEEEEETEENYIYTLLKRPSVVYPMVRPRFSVLLALIYPLRQFSDPLRDWEQA